MRLLSVPFFVAFAASAALFGAQNITFIPRPFEKATMTWDEFLQRVEEKALNEDFVLFRGRKLTTHRAYHRVSKAQRKALADEHALVLIKGKIENYIRFSELGGVSIATNQNAFVTFDMRYLETLRHIGIGSDFYAMCVLPRYDKCLLLRYLAFDPSLPPVERIEEFEYNPPIILRQTPQQKQKRFKMIPPQKALNPQIKPQPHELLPPR